MSVSVGYLVRTVSLLALMVHHACFAKFSSALADV